MHLAKATAATVHPTTVMPPPSAAITAIAADADSDKTACQHEVQANQD
jgi:hypothetical protein